MPHFFYSTQILFRAPGAFLVLVALCSAWRAEGAGLDTGEPRRVAAGNQFARRSLSLRTYFWSKGHTLREIALQSAIDPPLGSALKKPMESASQKWTL